MPRRPLTPPLWHHRPVSSRWEAAKTVWNSYLQQVLTYSALRTGLAMIPMSVAMIAGTVGAKSLLPRLGARRLLVAGAVLGTAGVAWLSRLPLGSAYALHILGPTLVLGVGFGATMLPVSEAATAGIGPVKLD
jgi:Na+/melibiose symporter-like transporter